MTDEQINVNLRAENTWKKEPVAWLQSEED
jgi:hypothetical protein